MNMMSEAKLSAALAAVASACRITRYVQSHREKVRQITKSDRSPVTVADFAVQAIVAMDLRDQLGEIAMIGEEESAMLREPAQAAARDAVISAARTVRPNADPDEIIDAIDVGKAVISDAKGGGVWTLDPIDGTKGYLRGQQYAIALAYIERGAVTLGVMGCPSLPQSHTAPLDRADERGTIYFASIGSGAFELPGDDPHAAPKRIAATLSPPEESGELRICESLESDHSDQQASAHIARQLGSGLSPVRLDSQCKYAVVARGQADAYMRLPTDEGYIEKIWDHAAGAIIASEAGAVVTDIHGARLDFSRGSELRGNSGIICAAPHAHGRIIAAIEALGLHEACRAGR
jgi:3'(2'), 5'-bisphosphate nucleotidase